MFFRENKDAIHSIRLIRHVERIDAKEKIKKIYYRQGQKKVIRQYIIIYSLIQGLMNLKINELIYFFIEKKYI